MNFREFCLEPGYSHFIGMTFNIDLQYFESIVLHDLFESRTTNVLIFCDADPLQKSLSKMSLELNSLGKQFILQPVHLSAGAFHPKLYVKIGSDGASIFLGSGNLSFGGGGGNKEVYSIWKVAPERFEIVDKILSVAESYSKTELTKDFLDEIRTSFSIPRIPVDIPDLPFVISSVDNPLSKTIESRWKGRKFNKLTIFTGSTDEKGAFIDWCNRTFKINECTLVANEQNVSFEKRIVQNLPIRLQLGFSDSDKYIHSKIYLFENKDEVALISGSANCSAAAWLAQVGGGGNVEAINVYDSIDKKSVSHLYEEIPEVPISINEWKPIQRIKEPQQKNQTKYIINEMYFEPLTEIITLVLENPVDYEGDIFIRTEIGRIQFIPTKRNNSWQCNIDSARMKSNIVAVEFVGKKGTYSVFHWIDFPEEIKNFSINHKIRSALTKISSVASYGEFNKLLEELAEIQSLIFDNSNYHSKSFFTHKDDKPNLNEGLCEVVTDEIVSPDMILKSISDFSNKHSGSYLGSAATYSFAGIIKYLFDDFKEPLADDYSGEDEDDEDSPISRKKKDITKTSNVGVLPKDDAERMYRKLDVFIEELIKNIQKESFIQSCTARQLSDAISYCLMVSNRVLHKSSIYFPLSNKLVFEVMRTLFYFRIKGCDELGIYNYIFERYKTQGKESEFVQHINNGYLWIALLYAIVSNKSEDPSVILLNSIILKNVFKNDKLYNHIDINRMGMFSSQPNLKENLTRLFLKLPEIIKCFEMIEDYFDKHFDTLKINSVTLFGTDQIVFSKGVRWSKILKIDVDRINVLKFSSGKSANFLLDGYWVSPKLLRSKKTEVSELFTALESQFKIN